jgi:hypothetical protein
VTRQNDKAIQRRAVEREYIQALEEKNWALASRIAEANKDLELFYFDLA